MPYLNLDLDYFSHPKTRRLIGLLGGGSEVYPLRLWAYAGKFYASDGCLSDYSVQEFESALEWNGEKGELFEAMKKVGFVHQDSRGIYIHDWEDHAGHLKVFKERAQQAARERWGKYAKSGNKQCYKHTTSNAPTIPNHTLPYLTKPNQKKEKKKYIKKKNFFGLHKNVLLSETELEELKQKLNGKHEEWIETLSAGIALKGYKYKSHYLAILNWLKRDEAKKPIWEQ